MDNLWMVGPLAVEVNRPELGRLFGRLRLNYLSHVFAFVALEEGENSSL